MRRKLSYIFICICILINLVPQCVAETEPASFTEEKRVAEAAGLWDSAFDNAEIITRGMLAKAAVKVFCPYFELPEDSAVYYLDVPPESENAAYINEAARLGFVKGTEEKRFSPDENATVEQAMAVFMRALGYSAVAERGGGYSAGYFSQEAAGELLSGLNGSEPLTPYKLARMIYNALELPLLNVEIKYADIVMDSSSLSETTILSMRNMYLDKGIITGNSITHLDNDGRVGDGYVEINGNVYKEGVSGAGELIGYNVNYLYSETVSGDDELLCVYKVNANNGSLTINAHDISDFIFSERKYEYETESGRIKTVSFDKDADIIFNGKASAVTEKDFVPSEGYVELIDNDNDGSYEVVRIKSYTDIFVSTVDSVNGIIIDNDYSENNMEMNINDTDFVYSLKDTDGKSHRLFELSAKDVVSAAVCKNGTYAELIYSRQSVEGMISSTDISNEKIYIDGTVYELAGRLIDNMDFVPGDSVTAYLNFEGKIAALKRTASAGESYAYLLGIYHDENEEKNYVRLYDSDGSFKSFQLAEKLKIDGTACDSGNYNTLYGAVVTNGSIQQLIRYKCNAESKINFIDTIKNGVNESETDRLNKVPYLNTNLQGGLSSGKTGALTYESASKSFSYRVFMRSTSKIMYIPYSDTDNMSAFSVKSAASFADGDEELIEAYNTDGDNRYADILLSEQVIGDISYSTSTHHIGVVKKLVNSVDEDNESRIMMTALTMSGEETVILKNRSSASEDFVRNGSAYAVTTPMPGETQETIELKAGDMVRYMVEDGSMVYGIRIIFDTQTRRFYNPTTNSAFASSFRMTGGMVERFSDSLISVKNANLYSQIYGGASNVEHYPFGQCSFITVDMSGARPEVTSAAGSDIKSEESYGTDCSWMIYFTKTRSPQMGVIYNGLSEVPNVWLEEEDGFVGYTDAKPYVGFVYPY